MSITIKAKSRSQPDRPKSSGSISNSSCRSSGHCQSKSRSGARHSPEMLGRLRDWIEKEIAYVKHPLFRDGLESEAIQKQLAAIRPASLDQRSESPRAEVGLAFVAGMVEMPLLSPEEEQYLFAQMNFIKWRAEKTRRKLTLNDPDISLVDLIEADLCEADAVRNRIVCSNLRLVVALATKLTAGEKATALDHISELVSEGTIPLIRAVELFDVSLGNRFSTYATWAVRNQMFRSLKRRRVWNEQRNGHDETMLTFLEDSRSTVEADQLLCDQHQNLVRSLLSQLTERERTVITARYGLDGQPTGQSLNDIAQQIGLSKERVRQVALSSIEKLRELVLSSELDG